MHIDMQLIHVLQQHTIHIPNSLGVLYRAALASVYSVGWHSSYRKAANNIFGFNSPPICPSHLPVSAVAVINQYYIAHTAYFGCTVLLKRGKDTRYIIIVLSLQQKINRATKANKPFYCASCHCICWIIKTVVEWERTCWTIKCYCIKKRLISVHPSRASFIRSKTLVYVSNKYSCSDVCLSS